VPAAFELHLRSPSGVSVTPSFAPRDDRNHLSTRSCSDAVIRRVIRQTRARSPIWSDGDLP
jgi:hypothetical protein